MLTDNELVAVNLAERIQRLISGISAREESSFQEKKTMYQAIYRNIENDAYRFLNIIKYETNASHLQEVKNYYYRNLLDKLSRFNGFFSGIKSITDERNGGADISIEGGNLTEFLNDLGMEAIEHPLLVQSAPKTMTVKLKYDKKFREHYEHDNCKFYNKKTTPEGKEHQDVATYRMANVKIALATQISNLSNFFTPNLGQRANSYFKAVDKQPHDAEKKLFNSAIKKIQTGMVLSDEETHVLSAGEYYRYPTAVNYPADLQANNSYAAHRITHIGHASEIISFDNDVNLTMVIDPVHYQSGTDGIALTAAAKLFYDRQTSPALSTTDYPAVQIVVLSHNHHDHLCPRSLKEAFDPVNTLFIVPKGDALLLKEHGLKNVIEFNSWNDVAEINLTTYDGKSSTYEIRSFPAKHASNRSANDFYHSLFMGFLVRDTSRNHTVLFTGDTAILDDEHFENLQSYLLEQDLYLHSACIASGPDKPRKFMECTHQSSADALVMHARFNLMNAILHAHKLDKPVTRLSAAEIKEVGCFAIGYHQGCFRLGLLTLQDVNMTVMRMLAVLQSLNALDNTKDLSLKDINKTMLDVNLFFQFLDTFEQAALVQTIELYQQCGDLSVNETIELITSHLNIPHPGIKADFTQEKPNAGFKFDYERLLQNRDRSTNSYSYNNQAYEYFASHLNPELQPLEMIKKALQIYLDRPRFTPSIDSKKSAIIKFMSNLENLEEATIPQLACVLGKLYSQIIPMNDNEIRDEGHAHTLLTILGGLLYFPEFNAQFKARHQELNSRHHQLAV